MREVSLLPEKQRKKWTKVFVACVLAMALTCIGIMNYNYDVLARYPYKDENSRALIRKYLNTSEIEYIIEYSIPPNMFIAFIAEPGFSIYHAAEYKQLSQYEWQETPANIVKMVEETRSVMDVQTLAEYLSDGNYAYSAVHDYVTGIDAYAKDSSLILYAGSLDSWVDQSHTVSTRTPQGLAELIRDIPTKNGASISIREDVEQPLVDLCTAAEKDISNGLPAGGLLIEKGYTGYADEKELYEQKKSQAAPGHDEHQLGLAIDFAVQGISDDMFEKTVQSQWLEENAWEFGFVQTRTAADQSITGLEAEPYHYRYVGIDTASALHSQNMTLAQYKASRSEAGNTSAESSE